MNADKKQWSPDREEALKALIRKTIDSAGPVAPDALPHKIKQLLRGQIESADGGEADIDAYIDEIMSEKRKPA